MRVVGIVAPFAPMVAGTRGKFVLSSPMGEMGPENVRRVPLAAVRHGRARQTSESGPVGDCRSPVGTGPAGSVFGENSFYREIWGTGRGGSPGC